VTTARRIHHRRRRVAVGAASAIWLLAFIGSQLMARGGDQPSRSTPDGHSHHAPAQARLVVNPLQLSAEDLARGRALYEQECSSCHGDDGKAQTARAGRLQKRPTDLTNPELARHADGELFYVVTHGIPASKMPGYEEDFSADDRWRIVAYVRSLRRAAIGALPSETASVEKASGDAPAYAWNLPPGFPLPKVPADNPMTAEKVELGRHLGESDDAQARTAAAGADVR
jgi:mono/diheme cytochrome c family protein